VIPFLWVLPLALYLLSFIICFDNPRWYARVRSCWRSWRLGRHCWVLLIRNVVGHSTATGIYCAGLFICCMVCHGELYRLRPDPRI